jgi:transposase
MAKGALAVERADQRLIAKGREPKAALIACMRKLIVILNTMIARRQKWDPNRYAVS